MFKHFANYPQLLPSLTRDVGLYYITIDAFPKNGQVYIETTFSIEVLPKDNNDLIFQQQQQRSECFRESAVQCSTSEPKIVASMVFLSNLELDAPVNEEKKKFNLIETEQKSHSDTGL